MVLSPADRRGLYYEACRKDLGAFAAGAFAALNPGQRFEADAFTRSLAYVGQRLVTGRERRTLVTAPPRHGKSFMLAIAAMAFALGRDPTLKIMDVAYGETLSVERSRLFRALIGTPFFREVFPDCQIVSNAQDLQTTSKGGHRRALSLQGAMTGLGADLILIDDPMKAQNATSPAHQDAAIDAYRGALLSRLDRPGEGKILVVTQRLSERDLAGAMLETGAFVEHRYPAIAPVDLSMPIKGGSILRSAGEALSPGRFPLPALESLRAEMGPALFEAQYQQNPGAMNTGRVRWAEIPRYDAAPAREAMEWVVISLDPACSVGPTASWSVATVWGVFEGDSYLLDVLRGRWTSDELLPRVRSLKHHWRPDLLFVEANGAGKPIGQQLFTENRQENIRSQPTPCCKVILETVTLDKAARFDVGLEYFNSGRVKMPASAPWLEAYQRELSAFPSNSEWDQIDSTAQYLAWARRQPREKLLDRNGRIPRARPPGMHYRAGFLR